MANFSKSFNFRGGFQVDTDSLIVRGENVGVGSSVPTQRLDVNGIVKAKGLIVDSTEAFFIETASVGVLSAVTVESGIFTGTANNNGIATYYGDGANLLNLPTSQWLDIDVGLGFTSIYAQGNVGVDTTDPRFKFQVGGTPFGNPVGVGSTLPQQDGVAIFDGNIQASGIITTRGQFIGIGSYITALDADNMTLGTISTERYGPLIITEEVIADRFTGIASTALSLPPDTVLDITTVKADRIEATGKFIATEGYVQVGDDVDNPDHGDIEAFRVAGDTGIYSISEEGQSNVFVGQQRPNNTSREYGGLRKGQVASDPQTGENDLDLVNYDIGNVNFYLHSGSGGSSATNGDFRWIYGQNDAILATLSRQGTLNLAGNILPNEKTLIVNGEADILDNTSIAGDLSVSGLSTVSGNSFVSGDLTVDGTIITSGGISGGGNFDGDVQVGGDPTTGSSGVSLSATSGSVSAKNLSIYSSSGTLVIEAESTGDFTASGLGQFGSLRANTSITGETITATTSVNGPNFSLTATGLNVGSINANGDIDASGQTLTVATINATTANISDIIVDVAPSFDDVNVDTLNANSITCPNFNGNVNFSGDGTFNSLTINNNITANNSDLSVNSLSVANTFSVDTIDGGSEFQILATSEIDLTTPIVNAASAALTVSSITSTNSDITLGNFNYSFGVNTGTNELSIFIQDDQGNNIGAATLPIVL